MFNVESLETLGKLDTIEGVIYYIVKKLDVVKSELVAHVETNWRDWTFRDLLDALQKWTEVNSIAKCKGEVRIIHFITKITNPRVGGL